MFCCGSAASVRVGGVIEAEGAMAVATGEEERLLRQFWQTRNLTHRQCMKNLLQLMEVGDLDQKIPGLPSCPIKDRFECNYLSK